MHMMKMAEYHARESVRAAYLTNDPECRGMLLSEGQEWLQEARHRGSTLPLLADLILDVTSGEAEKLSFSAGSSPFCQGTGVRYRYGA
jgi:hypothetical protein